MKKIIRIPHNIYIPNELKLIYSDKKKEKNLNYLLELEKIIETLFLNKDLISFTALSIHKIIDIIIKKQDLTKQELEKLVYSLAYYFLKDYINIKKLIELSKISEKELNKESKESLELLKISYKFVENKDLNVNSIFERMKRFIEWINLQK
jgi:hypothetical protein